MNNKDLDTGLHLQSVLDPQGKLTISYLGMEFVNYLFWDHQNRLAVDVIQVMSPQGVVLQDTVAEWRRFNLGVKDPWETFTRKKHQWAKTASRSFAKRIEKGQYG